MIHTLCNISNVTKVMSCIPRWISSLCNWLCPLSSFLQPVTAARGYVNRWLATASALRGLCSRSAPSVSRWRLAATQWWAVRSATAPGQASPPLTWTAIRSADSAGTTRQRSSSITSNFSLSLMIVVFFRSLESSPHNHPRVMENKLSVSGLRLEIPKKAVISRLFGFPTCSWLRLSLGWMSACLSSCSCQILSVFRGSCRFLRLVVFLRNTAAVCLPPLVILQPLYHDDILLTGLFFTLHTPERTARWAVIGLHPERKCHNMNIWCFGNYAYSLPCLMDLLHVCTVRVGM